MIQVYASSQPDSANLKQKRDEKSFYTINKIFYFHLKFINKVWKMTDLRISVFIQKKDEGGNTVI